MKSKRKNLSNQCLKGKLPIIIATGNHSTRQKTANAVHHLCERADTSIRVKRGVGWGNRHDLLHFLHAGSFVSENLLGRPSAHPWTY